MIELFVTLLLANGELVPMQVEHQFEDTVQCVAFAKDDIMTAIIAVNDHFPAEARAVQYAWKCVYVGEPA